MPRSRLARERDLHETGPAAETAKTSPAAVARGVFDGLRTGEEDIAPDPISRQLRRSPVSRAAQLRFDLNVVAFGPRWRRNLR
jgi:hypothetical protein